MGGASRALSSEPTRHATQARGSRTRPYAMALVAIVVAQDLRHPRVDLRPIRPRWLPRLDQPLHRPPVAPQPGARSRSSTRRSRSPPSPELTPTRGAPPWPLPDLVADDLETPARADRHQPETRGDRYSRPRCRAEFGSRRKARERLKEFEPSTLCMPAEGPGFDRPQTPCKEASFREPQRNCRTQYGFSPTRRRRSSRLPRRERPSNAGLFGSG